MTNRPTVKIEGNVWGHVLRGGIVAGLVGGVAISVVMLLMALFQGRDPWIGMKVAAYPFFGTITTTPGFDLLPVLVGVAAHFAVSASWGAAFAMIAFGLTPLATVGTGGLWGFVVWIGMYYAVLPAVGASAVAESTPAMIAMLNHLVFGVAVGLGFLPYQRTLERGRRWWRGHSAAVR